MQHLSKISRLKPIPAALLALGMGVTALPAMATSLLPAGTMTAVNYPVGGVGITFYNGLLTIQCQATFNGGVPSGSVGAFSITHASFANGGGTNGSLCGLVGAAGFPWTGDVTSSTVASITGITLTLLGSPTCSGNITGGFANGTSSTPAYLTLTGHTLGSCTVTNGVLQVTNNSTSPGGLIYTP